MRKLLDSAALVALLCCAGMHSAWGAFRVPASKTERTCRAPTSQTEAAFLDISSDPPAKILIDEVDTGKVTPQAHLEVKPGRHKLTLITMDGARQRTLGFTVEAGQTRKFTVHLAP